MDTPIFYSALFIHIISLIVGFGGVIVIDTFGLLWLLKKVPLKTVNTVAETTQRLIWIGWVGLVCSGIVLITLKGYIDNLTWIKLFFVAMLGFNGIFLHTIKKSMEKLQNVEPLPARIMFRTSLASAISQLGWWGALSIGFVHRHIEHHISWPGSPLPYIIFIILVISIAALIGEKITNKKEA